MISPEKSPHRVAWLFPSLARASYWHPVLSAFAANCPNTIIFTGNWPGFAAGLEGSFKVTVVGKFRYIKTAGEEFQRTIQILPLRIVLNLLKFKPHAIFSAAFSMWTVLAIVLKPWMRWKIIIIYDGSSKTVDVIDSSWRLFFRRMLTKHASAFITNSISGKAYLVKHLKAKDDLVYHRPYEVPDLSLLMKISGSDKCSQWLEQVRHPLFLFVGQIVRGKGLHHLFEALLILKNWGYKNFTLMIIGDGPQRSELDHWIRDNGLVEHVIWIGWLEYGSLGFYFQSADILVFPTLADVWGMVVPEAMLFGKPILCSKFAGAADLVVNEENGFVFDPASHKQLAEFMRRFIDDPRLITEMGHKSKQMMKPFTAQTAANHLIHILRVVMSDKQRSHRAASF